MEKVVDGQKLYFCDYCENPMEKPRGWASPQLQREMDTDRKEHICRECMIKKGYLPG